MLTLELYRRVYLIRKAEEAIIERYMGDEMKTPVLSIGQEAIAVGVCYALGAEGQVTSTYRSHGVYLSKTLETDRYFAELYGRIDGVGKGKAGSMHLSAPEHGYLGSSAVVGTSIPVAVGAALANQVRKRPNPVGTFFGDGAIDEGVFYESLNFACLRKLKIIFVCEDNDLAIHTPAKERHGYDSIAGIARSFHCDVYESESTVAEEIHRLTREAMAKMESTGRPALLHIKYYRYLEHVGINEDFKAGYRDRAEFEKWKAKDPVLMQRKLLEKQMPEAEIRKLEESIQQQILKSIAFAEKSPFPPPEELHTDVLA